jgi:hypothetical protein
LRYKYKLTIVEVDKDNKEKGEVCLIGYFDSEEDLEKWTRESKGELKKTESS